MKLMQNFQATPVAKAPWAFIAIMGVTGSGKSTFIRKVSRNESVEIGDSLTSCTSELKGYSFYFHGYNVNLVDTPGFNDTFRSETEVLQDIAEWLRKSYEGKNQLSGIVYLHNINNVRIEGSAVRNLKMFRQLCGDNPLKNVILATTFWGVADNSLALAREKELRSVPEFWGGMLARGSSIERVTDRESMLDIISKLLQKVPETLQIQKELVEEDKDLINTAAGQTVHEELLLLAKKHSEEMEKLQEEMQDAIKEHDEDMQEILREQEKRLEREIAKVQKDREQLRYDRRAEKRRMESDFDGRLHIMEREYERKIRKMELNFDDAIALVRANESKLKAKERETLETRIRELSENIDAGSEGMKEPQKKRKSKGASVPIPLPLPSLKSDA